MFDSIWSLFTYDLAIDLGTSNTRIYVLGKGIAFREPTVVARHKKTKEVLAVGETAQKMIGKTPATIEAIEPLHNGVIADFDATRDLLAYYFKKTHQGSAGRPLVAKPKVIIGIPSGVTEVERRAIQDAALSAGARKAYLIEEPMAAAIGIGLPVEEAEGVLIVNIGGGTTQIAVISLGGIVVERSLRLAGKKMDESIINHVRLKHSLLLGERTAEQIKIEIGSAQPLEKEKHAIVRGRDLEKGLPKSVKVSSTEVREAIAPVVRPLVESVVSILEEMPPELVTDIVQRGIQLCGGGALLAGLDQLISQEVKMPVYVDQKAEDAVVLGCHKVLSSKNLLEKMRVTGGLR